MSLELNRRRQLVRSALVLVGLAAAVGTTTAAAYSFAAGPGYSYRLRYSTSNSGGANANPGGGGGGGAGGVPGGPGGPGGFGGGTTLARAVITSGDSARIDIIASPDGGGGGGGRGGGGGGGGLIDQYFLVLDSGKIVTVNTFNKTFTEGRTFPMNINGVGGLGRGRGTAFAALGDSAGRGRGAGGDSAGARRGGGAGGAGGAGGGGRGGGAGGGGGRGGGGGGGGDASILLLTSVNVKLERLPDDTLQGFKVRHYKMISEFTTTPISEPITRRLVTEYWTADLPFKIVNPWDNTQSNGVTTENLRELQIKQAAQRRQIEGTPIKVIDIRPQGGPLGGIFGNGRGFSTFADTTDGPVTTTTMEVTSIKPMVIPDSMFKIPADFTRGGGRGPGGGPQ